MHPCFENYSLFLLGIGSFERPSFQWQVPNLLFWVPVVGIVVVEVVDMVVDVVADTVVAEVGMVRSLAFGHSLVDLSKKNSGDFSIPDCKYLSKDYFASEN